jgi:hypothetical protein
LQLPLQTLRATPAVLACCLAIYLFPLATVAEAHVKWFVPCNTSDNPIPLSAVLTSTFPLFAALFVALYYGTWAAAVVPFASGMALLAIVFTLSARVRARGGAGGSAWFSSCVRGCRVALQRHE